MAASASDTKAMRRRFIVGLATMTGLALMAGYGGWAAGLRINTTDSMPRGVWLTERTPPHLAKGMIVVVCPPPGPAVRLALRRRYFRNGWCKSGSEPLLKPVVAVAGDVVQVSAAGISVDGVPVPRSALLTRDSAGRKVMPVAPGTYRVRPGQMWLVSSYNPRSFDSRYFGPVPVSSVQGLARSLWTWR
jgi:conjugative transfer signal peptidase TraF